MYSVYDIESLKLLIELNADVNIQNNDGETALMLNERDIENAKFLLNNGANAFIKNNKGQNVLWYPYNPKMIEFYFDYGLNKNEVDNEGKTLLFSQLDNGNLLQMLIKLGFDVNYKDYQGNTPLILCLDRYCQEILLKYGANINAVNNQGQNALIKLILMDYVPDPTSKLYLIEKGININHQDKYGNTALFYVIQKEEYYFVENLMQAGADPYIKNNEGKNIFESFNNKRIDYQIYENYGNIEFYNIEDLIYYYMRGAR